MNEIRYRLFLMLLLMSSSALYTMEDPRIVLETFSLNKSTKNQALKLKNIKKKLYNRLLKRVGKDTYLKEKVNRKVARQRKQQEMDPWAEIEEFIKWHADLPQNRGATRNC